MQQIQMQLSNKQRVFYGRFLYFWNLDQIQNILGKKDDPIGYVFPKLPTAKDVVR